MTVRGKVILITGASSGIGAGVAYYLACEGALLSLTGRNEANLLKAAKECRGVNRTVHTIVGDLTNEVDVKKILDETIKNFGKLDVLVNNAGILELGGIEATSTSQLDRIFAINVRAVYNLTMLATPFLTETKGNIINISSVAGTRPFPQSLAFCMSKSALDQFTKCVALELAPKGIRVNSINPGIIQTDIFRKVGMDENARSEFFKECRKYHPLGRAGFVEDLTTAIAFLASDEASFITGELLHIDGGLHATSTLGYEDPDSV